MTPTETQDNEGGDLDLFRKLKGYYTAAREHLSSWRDQAKEDYAFVAGDQWSEEDLIHLKKQLRPVITFNRVEVVVKSIAGLEVGNRQEIHYYPREVGDAPQNEILSEAAKFFRQESDTEDEESDAFYDAIICGIGWTDTRPDYEEDPDGLLPTERIDPLSCFWDPAARKRNLVERRFCGYEREFDIDDAKAMFPDVDESDLHAGWANLTSDPSTTRKEAGPEAYQETKADAPNRKKVTIVYFQWWERESYLAAIDPLTNQKTEIDPTQLPVIQARLAQMGMGQIKTVPMTRKAFKHAFVGAKILKSGPGRCKTDFTLNCITANRDRNANTPYGVVRAMKDPQRWANKFFSQILHTVNSNAKGGVMVEEDAVSSPRKFEENWAKPDGVAWLRSGASGKITPKPPSPYPTGIDRMLQFAISSIRDVTGVNLELLGMANRDQPGILEETRKQAGLTILATLFDALRRYRKIQGRVLLYLIQNYVPPGRLIRIDGETGPQYVPLALNPNATKYDVIVDEAAASVNQKEKTWELLVQMMPILQRQPLPAEVWAEILKQSPLPATFSAKVGQMLVQAQQAAAQRPSPEQQKLQIDQQSAQMKMGIEQQKAQADMAQSAMEMQMDQRQAQMEMAQEEAQFRQQMEQEHAQFMQTMAQKRAEHLQKLELQRQQPKGNA